VALIFDTGPIYASLDRNDTDYRRCRTLIEECEELRVIPLPVLPELDYLISERLGPGPMLALLRDIEQGAYKVEGLEHADYVRVREVMDRYSDADVGFVDASVLAIAERLREPKLATMDRRHFALMRPGHVDALELLPS